MNLRTIGNDRHFRLRYAHGDARHINSIYNRPEDTTRHFWTDRTAETRFTGPAYVLISGYTFSGGKEFAYDMQTQDREVLIGETTGGGANPGGPIPLAHSYVAFITSGRAINPVTGTNWEHVGVKPDIEVRAAGALACAYQKAIEAKIDGEKDARAKALLQKLLPDIQSGAAPLPAWKYPRG